MLMKFIIALLGPIIDTFRLVVGPFSIHFCFWHLLLKIATKTIILLFLDAILITRCQFHQHFTFTSVEWKCFVKLFSNNSMTL